MNNLITGKKAGLIIAGTALIVVAFLLLNYLERSQGPDMDADVKTTELNKADTPSGLPADLPIEAGSKTIQNYESEDDDGRLQSTKKIEVNKGAKENLDFYIEFFEGIGYNGGYSEAASSANGQQVAQMQKENNTLLIVATPKGADKSIIEFTVTQKVY